MFLGTREQLISAFGETGWMQADDLGVSSALKAAQATARQTGYPSAPVSALLLENRMPDLVFQKSGILSGLPPPRTTSPLQVAGRKPKWSHRIDPHIARLFWITPPPF
jgi:hypothetical protein